MAAGPRRQGRLTAVLVDGNLAGTVDGTAGGDAAVLREQVALAVEVGLDGLWTAGPAHDLQSLSQGRFTLGLGSQVEQPLERRFGIPCPEPPRMQGFILAVEAIWSCRTGGDRSPSRAASPGAPS